MLTKEELKARWKTPDGRKRLAAVIRSLRKKQTNWEIYLDGFIGVSEIENRRDLRAVDFSCYQLNAVDLRYTNLSYSLLWGASLKGTNLQEANLEDSIFSEVFSNEAKAPGYAPEVGILRTAHLENAYLKGARLNRSRLVCVHLEKADISEAHFDYAIMNISRLRETECGESSFIGAVLSEADFEGADLWAVNFENADLHGANLKKARLHDVKLRNAILSQADLTGARFDECELNNTSLEHINFGPDHPSSYDGSDTIICTRRNRWLNWKRLRFIGKLPFFEVSWIGFTISLVIIFLASKFNSLIAKLNQAGDLAIFLQHLKNLRIEAPHLIWLALYSTFFLLLGSLSYRFFCPDTIQEFSEVAWVSEHNKPRLIYFRESWSKHGWQWATLLATATGGFLLLYIIIERLVVILSNFPDDMLFYLSISISILLTVLIAAQIFIHWDWVVEKGMKLMGKNNKEEQDD